MKLTSHTSPKTYFKTIETAFTFDDVLLQPGYSEVLPHETKVDTYLTQSIKLNIPFLSAAMDTVTEEKMATAIAREGGLGVIHKNMSIEQQAEQVRRVKRSENGIIANPITLYDDALLGDALSLKNKYNIGGIPIVDHSHKLVGILTNRDVRFAQNPLTPIRELMTSTNLITATAGISLLKAESILNRHKKEKLPLVNKKGKLVGLVTYRDILNYKNYPNATKDKFGRLHVGAAIGITSDIMNRIDAVYDAGVDVIVLDSAHGHTKNMIDWVRKIKAKYKDKLQLMAGNIATSEAAIALRDAGADAVKVGIGPGSICTTRVVTGIGVPQLTAIMNVAQALKKTPIGIVADGGIRYSGDVVKALAAGASAVMMGGVFAGTDESPGETILFEGRKFKQYRGMGSIGAMKLGSADRYFQKEENFNTINMPMSNSSKFVPEGIEGRVAYKGLVSEVIYQYVGGLRSGMGYCGAKTVKELCTKANFVRISPAGVQESHPHNIDITKESPNYSRR